MKEKKQPIVLDLDIFIHLMTSAYREGFKAGAEQNSYGMLDLLKEPETSVQH